MKFFGNLKYNSYYYVIKSYYMGKHTKKWEKDFEKRYSSTIKELQALEEEYKEMKESNPDKYISVWPDDSYIGFGELDGFYVTHYPENHDESAPQEHVGVTLKSTLGSFTFHINTFDQLKEFRNEVIDAMDSFNRPVDTKVLVNDDCEDEEGWEDNEETEYTIQASRTCVQTWTHTVMARSACEAYRLVQEDPDGSTHDENDDYNDYGNIDYEII
jgi:hypothetical protein